ncbi:cytochrome c [Photobacterium makurazakiensis]|uniref:cytochrome c n=1 Tax=Photobacterium makurazakiensis TaxID=2910234 RepID=UPI003D0ECEAB
MRNVRFLTVMTLVIACGAKITAASADPVSSETAIAERQAAFRAIEQGSKQISRELKAGNVDWSLTSEIAGNLEKNSTNLVHLFPEGSSKGSKSKEKVWQDKSQFDRMLDDMAQGFVLLNEATENQDPVLAQRGLKQAESTCRACHRQYRSLW